MFIQTVTLFKKKKKKKKKKKEKKKGKKKDAHFRYGMPSSLGSFP